MVLLLSYLIAIIITIGLAIFLYPIAGLFWVLGLFGKVSDIMFRFTTRIIRSLWRDIRGVKSDIDSDSSNSEQWKCSCGKLNGGKYCSECGKIMPETIEY